MAQIALAQPRPLDDIPEIGPAEAGIVVPPIDTFDFPLLPFGQGPAPLRPELDEERNGVLGNGSHRQRPVRRKRMDAGAGEQAGALTPIVDVHASPPQAHP